MKIHKLPLLAVGLNILMLGMVGCQIQSEKVATKTQQPASQQMSQQPAPQPPADPFQKTDGYWHGTVVLTGYLKIDQRICKPGDMCGKTVDYASFVIQKADQKSFDDFIKDGAGNGFVGPAEIGIGCYEKAQNQIHSENDASADGINISTIESTVSGNDLTKLLAATKQNPVQLQLSMPLMKSGRGAPDCYSIFRSFKVL